VQVYRAAAWISAERDTLIPINSVSLYVTIRYCAETAEQTSSPIILVFSQLNAVTELSMDHDTADTRAGYKNCNSRSQVIVFQKLRMRDL